MFFRWRRLRHPVDGHLHPAEHQYEIRFLDFDDMVQHPLLVPVRDRDAFLVDLCHRQALGFPKGEVNGVVHVLLGQSHDLVGDRRGHEDRLVVLLDSPEDLPDVFPEADVQHPIDLVEHGQLDLVVGKQSPLVHVHGPGRECRR